MKKLQFKGIVLGMAIVAIAFSIITPVLAEMMDITQNGINIRVNGVDVTKQGEMLTLTNGTQVPYSIGYNGTNYLPIGKMAELFNITASWDGTTRTGILTGSDSSEPTPAPSPSPTNTIPM